MKKGIVHSLLSNMADFDYQSIWDSEGVFFWVDWREDDVDITRYCESVLKTRVLSSHYRSLDNGEPPVLLIVYNNHEHIVPLIYAPDDRHITLFTLNEILKPEYEIRLLIESASDDTLGFLPLKTKDWQQLEQKYGHTVADVFAPIVKTPNFFTQGYDYVPQPTWQELASDNQQKSAAIKLYKETHQCGLMQAKQAVEEYIEHLD